MANELLIQPESDTEAAAPSPAGHELDAFLGKAFEEKPIWTGLYENIRDVFFPAKLPPLELTSTPIPVPDRMAVKRESVGHRDLDDDQHRHSACLLSGWASRRSSTS